MITTLLALTFFGGTPRDYAKFIGFTLDAQIVAQIDHVPVIPKITAVAGVGKVEPFFPTQQYSFVRHGSMFSLVGKFYNPSLMMCENSTEKFEWGKSYLKSLVKGVDYEVAISESEITIGGAMSVEQLLSALYPDMKVPQAFFGKMLIYVNATRAPKADVVKALGRVIDAEIVDRGKSAQISFYSGRIRERYTKTLEEYESPGKGFLGQIMKFDHAVVSAMSDSAIGRLFGGNVTEVTLSEDQVKSLHNLLEADSNNKRSSFAKGFFEQFKFRDAKDPITLTFAGFGKAMHVFHRIDASGKKIRVSF